jgi:hypothetical protein
MNDIVNPYKTKRKRRLGALAALPVAVLLSLAQCGGSSTTPTSMPSNAPASVKNANNCIPQRSDTFLILVGSGGQGWWVAQGFNYDWATGQYGSYDIYGWVEYQEGTCPNTYSLGYVYDSGF